MTHKCIINALLTVIVLSVISNNHYLSNIISEICFYEVSTFIQMITHVKHNMLLQELEVFIKWPNDIYYKKKVKLGGILVTAYTMGADTTAIIGV